jgi:hypothetical protein
MAAAEALLDKARQRHSWSGLHGAWFERCSKLTVNSSEPDFVNDDHTARGPCSASKPPVLT